MKSYLTRSDIQCFNHHNNTYKNEKERRINIEKTLLIAKSANMMSEIYCFERDNGMVESESELNGKNRYNSMQRRNSSKQELSSKGS